MKTRVISSLIAGVVLIFGLLLYQTFYFNIIICIIAWIAIYEVYDSIFEKKHVVFLFIAYTMPIFIMIMKWELKEFTFSFTIFVYLMINFILSLKYHKDTKIETLALFMVLTCGISLSLNCSIAFRDSFPVHGIFYILLALGSAWLADIGAYFSGYYFGKTKLAPHISPKKTIEGAVGGVLFNVIVMQLILFLYQQFIGNVLQETSLAYIIFVSLCASVMGILGDLTASIIKRQHNVKDFGNIMPGHGGAVDRFDSVLFTMPTVYFLIFLYINDGAFR